MGRRKIELKMVRDTNARQVTFSKRRNGLFKKANELVTLCATQVAIVVFSPGGKPYSFGHPSVNSVSQRFLNQDWTQPNQYATNFHPDQPNPQQQEDGDGNGVEDLSQQLTDLLQKLEIEKIRGKELDRALKKETATCKHCKPFEKMDNNELLDVQTSLEKLQQSLKSRASEIDASSSLLLLNDASKDADN